MNPNMSIYRQLNTILLVQVGVILGLIHWVNMSNISLTPFSNSRWKLDEGLRLNKHENIP